MAKYADRVKVTTATTGTGTITLGAAVSGYRTVVAAGLVNGDTPEILIEDGLAWEISGTTYTSASSTMTRTLRSSSTGSLLNLSGSAVVSVIVDSTELNTFVTPGGTAYGSIAASSPADLSKHLALWSTTYGLSVTGNTLNVVSGGNTIQFVLGSTVTAVQTATSFRQGPTPATHANSPLIGSTNVNSYGQVVSQNLSSGTTASSDLIATANDGTDTTNYVDLGVNSSGNTDAAFTIVTAHGGYCYSQGGDFAIGTASANDLIFFTGGTLAGNERMRISSAGVFSYPAGTGPVDPILFGTGFDGDLTIAAGTTTLVRDTFYRNGTITGTGKVNCAGFRLFFSGVLDLSNAGAGAIFTTAGTGGAGTSAGVAGGGAGNVAFTTVPGHGPNGGNGATGTTAAGAAAAAASAQNSFTLNGRGSVGGAGGAGTSGAGGAGGAVAATGTIVPLHHPFAGVPGATTLAGGNAAPAGGGSGSGDGTNVGGGGGGGSTPGSTILLFAFQIIRGGSTPAGCIAAKGGPGGVGGTPTTGNCGGGGGGGASPGGYVFILCQWLTGTTATNAIDTSGGTGGNGGAGVGTGIGGTGGRGGGSGGYTLIVMSGPTVTFLAAVDTPGTAGSAGSGITAGTGGAGVTKQIDL